jgi:ribonucleoside-diphosphate reductase alpha chain
VQDISTHIWDTKYRADTDATIKDTWLRISRALSDVEPGDKEHWQQQFYHALSEFRFLPGGRIQAGTGTERNVTLFNCFVMGVIDDSMEGIFNALKEGALTMQQGGGIGYDFSSLRPHGARARHTGTMASGPVSFMHVWDAMCDTLLSTGSRRGAMMATLRCDHPDIEEFISAKQHKGALRHFNLSVQITDAFMTAVRDDADWPLVFPESSVSSSSGTVLRTWPGYENMIPCRIIKHIKARSLWQKILRATYDYAEPGVLFIDRINDLNNLWYRERISATNPCGEIPLPPYGACDLGSLNLVKFVRNPFTDSASVDFDELMSIVRIATRMLDNVIEVSRFPLERHEAVARNTRRIGLGITGLADAFVMLGIRYGSPESLELAARIMRTICHTAYQTSIELAGEKGSFPFFDEEKYLQGKFIQGLPEELQARIARWGIRNSHLIGIAPTGTISLLANNVSSGLEPIFAPSYHRKVMGPNGSATELELTDYAVQEWQKLPGHASDLPETLICAEDIPPPVHLEMQAALQTYVDSAISKTINIPEHYPFDEFEQIYDLAYDMGLKGCTTYRSNPVREAVLTRTEDGLNAPHCCTIEREAD